MIAEAEMVEIKRRAREQFVQSGALLRPDELDRIFVEDFSLGDFDRIGLAILQVVDAPAVNVRLYAMRPHQLCPEHRHRPQGDYAGKEETFRCQWGTLYVCLPGDPTQNPRVAPPANRRDHFTVWNETVLRPGDQLTSPPDTLHWFQAGPEGAVVWAFCSRVVPGRDEFTDPDIAGLTSGLQVTGRR
jgi:D-lyxose ketol-isomerase